MPKLPVLSPKKLIKILEKLGFQLDHITGSILFFIIQEQKREQ
jgi:predicted RNA binding protein YcfA (HicA-like mRNA interferase family)